MAAENKRRRKSVSTLLPTDLLKEKVKNAERSPCGKDTTTETEKKTIVNSLQKRRKLQPLNSCETEMFLTDTDSTSHFFSLSQPPASAKKNPKRMVKFVGEHFIAKKQIQAQISPPKEAEKNVFDKNNQESSVCNIQETESENLKENYSVCSNLMQTVSRPKNEFSKYGREITCTPVESKEETTANKTVSPTQENINNIVQTDKEFAGSDADTTTANNDAICDLNNLSTEKNPGNYDTECLKCEKQVLRETNIGNTTGETTTDDIKYTVMQPLQTEMHEEKKVKHKVTSPKKLTLEKKVTSPEKLTQENVTSPKKLTLEDKVNSPRTLTLKENVTSPNNLNLEEKHTSPKKMTQSFVDTAHTASITDHKKCLVPTNKEHSIDKCAASPESSNGLLITVGGQEESTMQNENHLKSTLSQSHKLTAKEKPSNGECSDIVGDSQDDKTNSMLQFSMRSQSKVQEDPDMFKASTPQTSSSEIYCSQTTHLISPNKLQQKRDCSITEENVSVASDSNSNEINSDLKDRNFSHLFMKQEAGPHDEKSLQNCNTEVMLDEKPENKTENQLENYKHEEESFFKEVHTLNKCAEQSAASNQSESKACTVQPNVPGAGTATSLQVANLDDDLEISTSQLQELESEFNSAAAQQHDTPEPRRGEPAARQSLLPRHVRAPTVDWVQRAEHNRQRLQSIIQDICKLNALLARARRMMWKQ